MKGINTIMDSVSLWPVEYTRDIRVKNNKEMITWRDKRGGGHS